MLDLNLLLSQNLRFFYTNYVIIKICNGCLFDDSNIIVWTKIDNVACICYYCCVFSILVR